MDEEALFKTRLSIDERSFKRCLKRFNTFLKAFHSNQSSAECEHLYDLFKIDLLQNEISLSCLEMTHVALEKDEQDCEEDLSIIEEEKIKATELAILTSQQVLNRERKASSQKLEYNNIIKKIQEHHSRDSLNNSIAEAQTSIKILETERESQHQCSIFTKEKLQQILDSLQDFHSLVTAVENSPAEALLRFSAFSSETKMVPEEKETSTVSSSGEEALTDTEPKSCLKPNSRHPKSSASRSRSLSSSPKPEERTDTDLKTSSNLEDKSLNPKRRATSPNIEEGEWEPRSPKKAKPQ